MFGLGLTEIIIIAVLVLVLFGAGKIPTVMADLGKGIQSFKKAVNEPAAAPPAGKKVAAKKPAPKTKKRG